MTHRVVTWMVIVLVVAAGAYILDSKWGTVLFGSLQGEPFARGMPLSYWVESFKKRQYSNKAADPQTGAALKELGNKAIPPLLEILTDDNPILRNLAAEALGDLGDEAVMALREALASDNDRLRFGAARALCRIGPEAKDAIPDLMNALQDKQINIRLFAANGLKKMGPAAVTPLCQALKNDNQEIRHQAMDILRGIGEPANAAGPILMEALKDSSPAMRADAAAALGSLGAGAQNAFSALLKAKNDPNQTVRESAGHALREIDPHYRQGLEALAKKNYDLAIECLTTSIKLDANYPASFFYRGTAHFAKKAFALAHTDFKEVFRLQPNFGSFNRRTGDDPDLTIACMKAAIELQPTKPNYFLILVNAYQRKKNYPEMIANFEKAIHLLPYDALAPNNLAWLLATNPDPKIRNGKKALRFARQACELTGWRNAYYLDTLAAAHAEAGEFADAVKWQSKALETPDAFGTVEEPKARQRLELFQQGKPYREE